MATQDQAKRNADILKMAERGATQAEIADKYGMTRSNVSQILSKLRKDNGSTDAPRRGRPRNKPVNAVTNHPETARIADELESKANELESDVNATLLRIKQMREAVKALRGE